MTGKLFQIATFFLFFSAAIIPFQSQELACKARTLAALKPIPKLKYECSEDLTDSSDEVLTRANRRKAINNYADSLEKTLTAAAWWKSGVDDLNACDFRRKAGAFSESERENYENGEYFFRLFGNRQFRVVAAADPCYQQGFNGADIFLLNRVNNKVFAAEVIDGFYTRADLPLDVNFTTNNTTKNKEPIIEIATTSGGLNPTMTNYYFTIDRKTNRAIPKNLFKTDGKMTNRITSLMLLEDAKDYDLPPDAEPLAIIKSGRLAESFEIISDTGETFGADKRPKFKAVKMRWNGKFYN